MKTKTTEQIATWYDLPGISGDRKWVSFEEGNMVLYSGEAGSESFEIKNLNLETTTGAENPFCIENKGVKIKLTLHKKFSDALVTINR